MTALACVLTLVLSADPVTVSVTEPKLRDELLARMKKEQDLRTKAIEIAPLGSPRETDPEKEAVRQAAMEAVVKADEENREWLKGVIEKTGWPGVSRVGKDGAQAAWLIAQHADADRPFQKKCLGLLKKALEAKEATPAQVAYLTDRVLVGEGKKQKYGTQLGMKDGKLTPGLVEDEDRLDERRKSLGLPPMAEYIKSAEAMYKVEKPKGEKK
jgi:hypothetical protein